LSGNFSPKTRITSFNCIGCQCVQILQVFGNDYSGIFTAYNQFMQIVCEGEIDMCMDKDCFQGFLDRLLSMKTNLLGQNILLIGCESSKI